MPEVLVSLRWPDGRTQQVYSPSLVVTDHLEAGGRYPVPELVERLTTALGEASERVRGSYGFPCSRAAASVVAVQAAAAGQSGEVVVEGFTR